MLAESNAAFEFSQDNLFTPECPKVTCVMAEQQPCPQSPMHPNWLVSTCLLGYIMIVALLLTKGLR